MNALATEVLAIYVELDEARKQRLLDYAQQLLEEQRAEMPESFAAGVAAGRTLTD
jgi:Spy/CpxP family protein refolding chaperone